MKKLERERERERIRKKSREKERIQYSTQHVLKIPLGTPRKCQYHIRKKLKDKIIIKSLSLGIKS